jgi:hypothetical protein
MPADLANRLISFISLFLAVILTRTRSSGMFTDSTKMKAFLLFRSPTRSSKGLCQNLFSVDDQARDVKVQGFRGHLAGFGSHKPFGRRMLSVAP